MSKPNPGSNEARFAGCTCPVPENNYGQGIFTDPKTLEAYAGVVFWYDEDCPVHAARASQKTRENHCVRASQGSRENHSVGASQEERENHGPGASHERRENH